MGKPSDLVQGTLDLLILKTLSTEARHGWAIAKRIQQISGEVLQVQQGSGATPSGTTGLDQSEMGRERDRTPGEVLLADRRRPQATRFGDRQLGTAIRSDQPDRAGGLGDALAQSALHAMPDAVYARPRRRSIAG
jgi:hypothetical protein